jgi:hypothetical protein
VAATTDRTGQSSAAEPKGAGRCGALRPLSPITLGRNDWPAADQLGQREAARARAAPFCGRPLTDKKRPLRSAARSGARGGGSQHPATSRNHHHHHRHPHKKNQKSKTWVADEAGPTRSGASRSYAQSKEATVLPACGAAFLPPPPATAEMQQWLPSPVTSTDTHVVSLKC